MFDGKAFGEQMVEVVRSYVDMATAPLLQRIADLEGRAVEPGPAGKDGQDAEPITFEQIAAAVSAYFAENPPAAPKDGADGKDGVSPAPEEVERLVGEAVERVVSALPVAKGGRNGVDGVSVAGAIIDREGVLVLTLSNGETRSLGCVVGRDGVDGKDGVNGQQGERGFSLDDFDTEMAEDGRTIRLKFLRGETMEIHEFGFPTMIYRGVFKEGQAYERGDTVTWGGSLWHCDAETIEKPGDQAKAWTLAAKRGRDGKDGAAGERGLQGDEGRPGRDLTQVSFNGDKH